MTIAGRDPSTDLALLRTASPGHGARVFRGRSACRRDRAGGRARRRRRLAATMGVISAVGGAWRTWQGGDIDRFVRADLSFYPRFSGSPLLDVAGPRRRPEHRRPVAPSGDHRSGGDDPARRRDAADARRADPARLSRRRAAAGDRRRDRARHRAEQPGRRGRTHRRRHHHRDRRRTGRRRAGRARAARHRHGRRAIADRRLRGGTPRQLDVVVGERAE